MTTVWLEIGERGIHGYRYQDPKEAVEFLGMVDPELNDLRRACRRVGKRLQKKAAAAAAKAAESEVAATA